ncbi:MAG: glycosyltransferase [Candidatus Saccharibacteria bacterium]|nr:glycosyltransferase [Candidatus Saccharibacteria bacterium]
MKIAFFSDCYLDLTGGITSSINAQKTELERRGHTVYIFSTSYPKTPKERQNLAKENIFPVPSCHWCFRGLTPVSRRPKLVEKWLLQEHPEIKDFDIYYIHYESGCSIAGLHLAKKLKIPSIQVMHGREDMGVTSIIPFGLRTIVATLLNWFHSLYIPHPTRVHKDNYLANTVAKAKMWTLMVNHANYADCVITPSHHFAKKLNHYGVKHKIKIFPNGYPDKNFPTNPSVKTLKLGQTLEIIWHSRLSGEKRILPFLRALNQVNGKYHLNVYGDGANLNKAKRYATKHHLNVTFHGNSKFNTVQNAILKSHLDVLASYNFDNYPMTLVEAEASGVPVFICDPDMQEIIPKDSYILSSGPTPFQMAEALNDLLNHPDKIQQMSKIMLKHRQETLISQRIKTLEDIFHLML